MIRKEVLGFSSIAAMCKHYGFNTSMWHYNKKRFKCTDRELLKKILDKKNQNLELPFNSLASAFRHLKISRTKWKTEKRKHPDLSPLQLFNLIKDQIKNGEYGKKTNPTLGFPSVRQMCLYYDLSEATWFREKKRNPEMTDKQILDILTKDKDILIEIPMTQKTHFERLFFKMEKIDDRTTQY